MHTVRTLILDVVILLLAIPATAQPQPSPPELLEYGVWLDFNAGLRDLDIRTLAADPQRPNRLYAGGEGYLYRSLDGGVSWDVVFTLRAPSSRQREAGGGRLYSLDTIEDLTDEQLERVDDRYQELEQERYQELLQEYDEYTATLIVDAEEDDLLEQALEEILATDPEAAPDSRYNLPPPEELPDNLFTQIAFDPDHPRRVYAASGRGLYRSEDHGASWERVYRGVGRLEQGVSSIAVGEGVVVIGTGRGAHRSTDHGQTWARVPGPPGISSIAFVAASSRHPQYMYLIAESRVYRSRDAGESWLPQAVPSGVSVHGFGNIVIDPENSLRVFLATTNGLQISTDGGNTFRLAGLVGLRERRLLWVTLYQHVLILGTTDGIYTSSDGGNTWQDLNEELVASVIYQVVAGTDDHIWIATNAGVFKLVHPWEIISGEEMARRAIQRWALEPDLGRTVRAALTYYDYADLPVDSWAARLFWSRFMPDVRVEYLLYQQRRETTDTIYEASGEHWLDGTPLRRQDDSEFRAMAWWYVSDLILDTREFSARDLGQRLVRRRNQLVRRVVRLYNGRRDLIMRIAEGRDTTLARQLMDETELGELTARLDLMTGGFFTAYSRIAQP